MELTESRNSRSGDSGCGAAPSRVHRRNGAAAAVGDEQGRAVGDTNGKHQQTDHR